MKTLLVILLALTSVAQAATTRTAPSASLTDVQNTINASANGDTVNVPAGTPTWSSYLSINKKITIQGAGIGNTVVTTGAGVWGFWMSQAAVLKGIEFVSNDNGSGAVWWVATPTADRFVIEDCKFQNNGSQWLSLSLWPSVNPSYGVVANCSFVNARVLVNADDWLYAWKSWNDPLGLGTDTAVYVEDCTFWFNRFGNCLDGNYGGRVVFRFNNVTGTYAEVHGNGSNNSRGIRKWEFYGNTFTSGSYVTWHTFSIRGGTGVAFSNVFNGTWNAGANLIVDVRRAQEGLSLGQDPLRDGNDAIPSQGTGTHTGANGATTLTDSTKSWGSLTAGRTVYSGLNAAFWIYNTTSGASGRITANTPTTVTVTLSGGSRQTWSTGDAYKITGGHWSRDGIGRSTDASLGTEASNPWPAQELDPAYFWANTMNGTTMGVTIHNNTGFWCQSGRDYYVNAGAKPGYTIYTYPHPARTGATPPPEGGPTVPTIVLKGKGQLNKGVVNRGQMGK